MDELQVPVDGLQHRINQDCLLSLCVSQQVGIGTALRFKQLKKYTGEVTGLSEHLKNHGKVR